MPVPMPSADKTDLVPPGPAEVRAVTRGLMGAIAPPAGLTELQKILLRALMKAMTGVEVDPSELDPAGPGELARALHRRNREYRTRIVHLMLLGELILVPLPPEVSRQVDAYAAELGISDGMLQVARDCASGALGLALIDFERNGYTAGWDPDGASYLHAQAELTEPWQQVAADPALAARWAALAQCGDGTLGQAVFRFYRARGFVFPGLAGSAPPYLAQHDWVHVLAGFGTTVESELEVFGMIGRAIPDPRGFSLLAMVVGLFETGYLPKAAGLFQADTGHLSKDGMAVRLADAMRRGALCGQDLMAVDWFEFADRPVGEVRKRLGIEPKSPDADAAGSVGPWQPGGISPFQCKAGQALAEAEDRPYESYGARPA